MMFCGQRLTTPRHSILAMMLIGCIGSACATNTVTKEDTTAVANTPPVEQEYKTNYKRIAVPTPPQKTSKGPTKVVLHPAQVRRVRQIKQATMNLDVRDVEIRKVLDVIAARGQVNIVTDDDIKGTITISVKEMKLDRLFLTVLQSKQLGYMARGNILHVASRTKLKAQMAR